MTDDTLLAERLAPLVDAPSAPDWGDVTRRVRRARRRRTLTAALVVVGAVVVAAPAFGLGRYAIDWLSADPAPDRVQLDFAQLGVGAPKGMDPGIVPERRPQGDRGDALRRAAHPLGRTDEERRLLRDLDRSLGRLPLASGSRRRSPRREAETCARGTSA